MATTLPAVPTYVPFEAAYTRTAAVNIVFSAIHLLVGATLCLLGRRAWRITCAIAVGLAFELIAAAVVFNAVGSVVFKSEYAPTHSDLIAFGITVGAGLVGFLLSRCLPQRWACGWWLGWVFLGPLAGLSVAFTLMIVKSGPDLLVGNVVGRWVIIAVFALTGLAAVTFTKWIGAIIATSLIGSWLLALGIDLLLNTNRGSSHGLRKLIDGNPVHQEVLNTYNPSFSTKLLFGLSWFVAIMFVLIQWYSYKDRWFLQIKPCKDYHSWKRWFCPFLLRSSSSSAIGPSDRVEKVDNGGPSVEAGDEHIKSSTGQHSRQNSSPDSTICMEADLAERGSLASGSDLRVLTRNYRRALEILESEDGHQPEETTGTVPIPIHYRPTPVSLQPPAATSRSGMPTSPVTPNVHQGPVPIITLSTRPALERSGAKSPTAVYRTAFGHAEQGDDQVPDLGDLGARRRADSDRGTSYSIPLTNVTSSEYRDRDMFRPPSWTGDLPWHPSMLRGDFDPSTLPRHPQDERHAQTQSFLDHIVPIQRAAFPQQAPEIITDNPKTALTIPHKSVEWVENDYELVNREGVAANGKPDLQISQPFQMPYASRPVSREGSPNPLTSLGVPNRNIPKAQRIPRRERHLFPSEDDLPDHTPSSPEGETFPAPGHSRFHTSQTFVDSPNQPGRDEYTTEVETSGDEATDRASTHASYSISNLRSHKRTLPTKGKGKSPQKQVTPTDSSKSKVGLPTRPITQSDLTPHLQDVQPPAWPRIIYNAVAPVSNAASLTGTPRGSGLHLFGHASETPAPIPVPRSELSEATVRPSQDQRRDSEHGGVVRQEGQPSVLGDGRKVRFFESGSRKTLRDRLLRRG